MEEILVKKLTFIIFVIISSFFIQEKAEAVFTIELNLYSINFENMDSGATGSYRDNIPTQGLEVTCTTDQGPAWFLNIRNDQPLTHTSNPASVIPDENFKWYGISTSDPINTSLVTTREDFTIERTIYRGADNEGANGTTITMKFELTVPPIIQSGPYSTDVVFTFTE